MERVKMIWDFRGPNARQIAEHHLIHLNEFMELEGWDGILSGTETISEMHHTAYMVVMKKDVDVLRNRLKPHRGQVYIDQ
jgi:hypothetical protein